MKENGDEIILSSLSKIGLIEKIVPIKNKRYLVKHYNQAKTALNVIILQIKIWKMIMCKSPQNSGLFYYFLFNISKIMYCVKAGDYVI